MKIEKLSLDGNIIGAEGAKYIARMIRKNDIITELSLMDSKIGDTQQGAQEICTMIAENCVLNQLNLSGNSLNDKHITILIEALDVIMA